MHKRKDYYHAGGYNGKGLRKELEEQVKLRRHLIHTLEGIVLTNVKRKPVAHLLQPPDGSFKAFIKTFENARKRASNSLSRFTRRLKGRTEAQKG